MPLTSVKLYIERKFFRDANLSWFNKESCYTARLTWPLMDSTNQSLGLGRDVISTTVAMLTGHCVVGRHAERMRLSFNDFCCRCRSAQKEETVIHFFFVSARLLLGADIGYLAHHFLSAYGAIIY